jgi:hypothetical protein
MKLLSTLIVLGLCATNASAQDELQIDVLGGHDTVVTAAGGRGADVRVRVLDRDRKPVEGAIVSAVLPPMGVGGHFRGGDTIRTERTDSRGEVQFTGIHLRRLTGDFTTRVLARSGNRTGTASVTQKVSGAPARVEGWSSRRRLIMLGVAGAGVAAGITALVYDNDPTTPSAGLTVTAGSPLTTGPR